MKAIITIETNDEITLYKAVSHLSFEEGVKVLEATVGTKRYQFSEKDKTKDIKLFLRPDFGKKAVLNK